MSFDHAAHDGEAQAIAGTYGGSRARGLRANEGLESLLGKPRRKPGSSIPHSDSGPSPDAGEAHFDRAIGRVSVCARVFEKIVDGTLQERRIEEEHEPSSVRVHRDLDG